MSSVTLQRPAILRSTLGWSLSITLAVAVPVLLAYNLPPSATFFNQAAALLGWGAWLGWSAGALRDTPWPRTAGLAGLQGALGVMLLSATAAPLWAGLPWGLALSAIGLIGAAMLAAQAGATLRFAGLSVPGFRALAIGLLVAGILSGIVGIVQYAFPDLADGTLIARLATPGRAGGNLRQPNHLSSLLLWSAVALVWLHEHLARSTVSRALLRSITVVVLVELLLGVVLSVSRTGMVCVGLLALWGLADRSLSRFARIVLVATPVVYILCWLGVTWWASAGAHAFAGESQLHRSDPSSSRYGIWANAFSLIQSHPWFGVGWGEFNFAWTMTAFPGRPTAFFDHTHNLPLQLLVELGLPLGLLVIGLLSMALVAGLRACMQALPAEQGVVRSAFVLVLMALIHSMLEYPLWYAYFLLPAAFAFGICVAPARSARTRPEAGETRDRSAFALRLGGVVLAVASAVSVLDYLVVVAIFSPPEAAAPLSARIEAGQRSLFFAHHADYASVTTAERPGEAIAGFRTATHYLLDARLMLAWSQALAERGDIERARYVADRLREFKNPQAEDFFAACDAAKPLPFQCTPAHRPLTFEDFR